MSSQQDLPFDSEAGEEPTAPPAPAPSGFSRVGWFLLIFLFLAAIVLDSFFSESGLLKIWQMAREHQLLTQEVAELEKANAEMEAQIEALRSDPEAIERVAREELGYIRPGEEVFLFPKKSKSESAGSDSR